MVLKKGNYIVLRYVEGGSEIVAQVTGYNRDYLNVNLLVDISPIGLKLFSPPKPEMISKRSLANAAKLEVIPEEDALSIINEAKVESGGNIVEENMTSSNNDILNLSATIFSISDIDPHLNSGDFENLKIMFKHNPFKGFKWLDNYLSKNPDKGFKIFKYLDENISEEMKCFKVQQYNRYYKTTLKKTTYIVEFLDGILFEGDCIEKDLFEIKRAIHSAFMEYEGRQIRLNTDDYCFNPLSSDEDAEEIPDYKGYVKKVEYSNIREIGEIFDELEKGWQNAVQYLMLRK